MTMYQLHKEQGRIPTYTVSVAGNGFIHGSIEQFQDEGEYNVAISRLETLVQLANAGLRLARYQEALSNLAEAAEKVAPLQPLNAVN